MHKRLAVVRDRFLVAAIWAAVALVVLIFAFVVVDLFSRGAKFVSWSFLSGHPVKAGRSGGIFPILVSTLLILLVATAAVMPFGLGTAILLSEANRSGSRFLAGLNISLDVLASVPSIVFALFGSAFFCVYLGMGYSILAGGLTVSCMILPIFIRTVESGLSAYPNEMRCGAAALGISKSAAIWRLQLPAAAPAIGAGLTLGIGRCVAETAALIFTSGYVDRLPTSLFDSGRSLAVHIYDLSMNVSGAEHNAYASVVVLIAALFLLNCCASLLAERLLQRKVMR